MRRKQLPADRQITAAD